VLLGVGIVVTVAALRGIEALAGKKGEHTEDECPSAQPVTGENDRRMIREFPLVGTSPLASVIGSSSNPGDASAVRKKCA
jgi:hypothetical protein